jgi:hypothetical protein
MRRIGFLGTGLDADPAWAWLGSLPDASPRRCSLDGFPLDEFDVLWVHASAEPPPLPRETLMGWVSTGGRLLLTQRATSRVVALALERDGPNDGAASSWRHDDDEFWLPEFRALSAFPHVRGLAAYGPHPLFQGMAQGTYVWAPSEGEPYVRAVYARGRQPSHGRAVACERSFVHLNADRIVAWEYAVGAGGVLCVGAFVVLGARDRLLERQLHAVLRNALLGEGIPSAVRPGRPAYWPGAAQQHPPAKLVVPAAPSLDGSLPDLEAGLRVDSHGLMDEAFTVAGRRVLVAGAEQSGVREIWVHPHRVMKDLHVQLGDETPFARDVHVTPAAVRRHLVAGRMVVVETVTAALEHPVVLLEYRLDKGGRRRGVRGAAPLKLTWTIDLRRMWPYPACGLHDLTYAVSPDGRSVAATHSECGGAVAVHAGRPVEWTLRRSATRPAIYCTVSTVLDEPLRLAAVGDASPDGGAAAVGARGVTALTDQRRRHDDRRRDELVSVRSPDAGLNEAFDWAKARLDAFVVDTPGVGRSLAGGYAAARPGWGDGRPGYAWYFGRDACWSALALLAAGDFSAARLVLRFLGATQDVTGKVIHEYTTSGLAHYDAADSTPLYLLLAGRLAQWTGDLAFLEERWPEIERAYRFCLETDTDGDGLIENTRVGHGWIEMGPLGGGHVTLYLAAVWTAALQGLAPVARALGRGGLGDELAARAAAARAALSRFRTDDGYALAIQADGSPVRHRTALTAVPLFLEVVDPAPAAAWLDAMASGAFTTPWGVRLIGRGHPLYNPAGYHAGAVWPLYTGWVSLAEYACHRGEQAYGHLLANARLPFGRALGAFDEVLHGDEERSVAICPDQAWSAAMLVSPVMEGLLGVKPEALDGRLRLAPHLPETWPQCEWRGVRVGNTTLDVRILRPDGRVLLDVRRTSGERLGVTFAPALPPGRAAARALVDGEEVTPRAWERGLCAHGEVRFDVAGEHEIEIWHR